MIPGRLRLLFAFAALASLPAQGGPLEDGLDAYRAKDYEKAIAAWRPLAEKGMAAAQYRIGVMYAEGKGVPADDAQAALWFERAAKQGDAAAQYDLGASYVEGAGVRKDATVAAEWFRRAAEQGYPMAQLNLGLMYAGGNGVAQDNVEAMKWIDLAVFGLPPGGPRSDAARALGDIAAKMTPEQIQDAKGRERAWKPKAEDAPTK
jgi:TPR repeat protein